LTEGARRAGLAVWHARCTTSTVVTSSGGRPPDEHPEMRFGIIALTDCSSIVMAHELGLFKKHGIESTISKEASWAVIRDRLTLGENQATHLLVGMAYAMTMGLQGSPQKPTIVPM
jgi:nitrate/nitrite transport system substrate-binding protein